MVKDSWSMLLNLTNKYNVKAKDHKYGGIRCASNIGPSFGEYELDTGQPLLGEGKVLSCVDCEVFMI